MKEILFEIMSRLMRMSKSKKIPLMFMGGLATSVWAEPRATYDVDGVIALEETNLEQFFNEAVKEGFDFDRNQPVKIIQGFPFITLIYPARKRHKVCVDLFLARSGYAKEALSRLEEITFKGLKISVIAPEDLILYKLISGRSRDIDDVREILLTQKGRLKMKYLKKWAARLGVITQLEDEISSLFPDER